MNLKERASERAHTVLNLVLVGKEKTILKSQSMESISVLI